MNFTTDSTIVSYSDNPATATSIKAAHITELRTAINAVRSLAGQSAGSWTHTTLTAQSSLIYADDVRDLRAALHDALTTLGIQTSNYTDNTITSYADDPLNATAVKAVHIRELRTRATSGAGNSTSGGSSGGLHYVLTDIQGSTRAVMNNNGSSSGVVASHDYLPFGEEIGSGIGLRSSGQGYGASDANRWKYGLTERDAASGLDHTWWRKYESYSGRWTSPDPLSGSIGDPQSFNHYTYTHNDPVNFVDPSGLDPSIHEGGHVEDPDPMTFYVTVTAANTPVVRGGGGGGRSPAEIMFQINEDGGGGLEPQIPTSTPTPCPGSIPEGIARQILRIASQENIDPTLLSVTMRHESSFGTNMTANPRRIGKGRNRRYVGADVGPMGTATNIWGKSPFIDGLTDPFGTVAMNWSTRKYESFNGNFEDNVTLAARAFSMDILPRSKSNADAAGKYRGPGDYQGRYNQYVLEAPGDRKQLNYIAGRR